MVDLSCLEKRVLVLVPGISSCLENSLLHSLPSSETMPPAATKRCGLCLSLLIITATGSGEPDSAFF